MFDSIDPSQKKQIRTLLLVFGSGLTMGIFIALAMLYYYNPTGSYLARNVLLAPENATSMRYLDTDKTKKEGGRRYILDDIEYSYSENNSRQYKRLHVDMEKYAAFYNAVSNDASLTDVDDKIRGLFNAPLASSILLKVRTENSVKYQGDSKPFLTIDFAADGNHFRVQLREQSATDTWAYYYDKGIASKVHNLFIPSVDK